MAEVMVRLFHLTGEPGWRTRTEAVLTAFTGQADHLGGMPTLLAAATCWRKVPRWWSQVPIPGGLAVAALGGRPILRWWCCGRSITGALPASHPAFGKTAGTADAVAFVCRRSVCGLPITRAAELSQVLRTRV